MCSFIVRSGNENKTPHYYRKETEMSLRYTVKHLLTFDVQIHLPVLFSSLENASIRQKVHNKG
jgi:hypothetical protein